MWMNLSVFGLILALLAGAAALFRFSQAIDGTGIDLH
jgi:hypothetical protein